MTPEQQDKAVTLAKMKGHPISDYTQLVDKFTALVAPKLAHLGGDGKIHRRHGGVVRRVTDEALKELGIDPVVRRACAVRDISDPESDIVFDFVAYDDPEAKR